MDSKQIKAAFASLEANGLVERTGEFRRSPKTGELQPVYRTTEKGYQRVLLERYPVPTPNEPSEANAIAALIACTDEYLKSLGDDNLYVTEVRHGVILYLNERTPAREGWYWGTHDAFLAGPFKNYKLAIEHVRRHTGKSFNLIVLNADNFDDADEPSPSGNLIVVDTNGGVWVSGRERPCWE
jgi:hypothetical protein